MFNIQALLRIINDLTRPYSPCAIPSHTGPTEEDTLVVFGPMPAPVASIILSPPKFVGTPLDKADRDIGLVVKSLSVNYVQLAIIGRLPVKPVAVEPADLLLEAQILRKNAWNDGPITLKSQIVRRRISGLHAQQACRGHMSRFLHAAEQSCSCKFPFSSPQALSLGFPSLHLQIVVDRDIQLRVVWVQGGQCTQTTVDASLNPHHVCVNFLFTLSNTKTSIETSQVFIRDMRITCAK